MPRANAIFLAEFTSEHLPKRCAEQGFIAPAAHDHALAAAFQQHRAQHPQEGLLLMGRLQHLGEDGAHGQAEGILPKKAQSALDTWTEPAPHFFTREMQRDLL